MKHIENTFPPTATFVDIRASLVREYESVYVKIIFRGYITLTGEETACSIMYKSGFSRVHLRNRSRKKSMMRVRDQLRKIKHDQIMSLPVQKALSIDVLSIVRSSEDIDTHESVVTDALD